MLKHLYKTFLVSILSYTLLIAQSSVVFAQAANESMSTDSKGIITHTKSHTFDKVSDTDMLASLGMLATGFIASRMIVSYKPMTNDVMIAGVGGAAFIAGEVMSNMKFKGTIDGMTVDIQRKSDGTVNEEQVQRLQDLKKSYEEAKDTTKTKKMMQLASAAAFAAAAALAGYDAWVEAAAMAKCESSIALLSKQAISCEEAFATSISPATSSLMVSSCNACVAEAKVLGASINKMEAVRLSPGISIKEAATVKPIQAAVSTQATTLCSKLPAAVKVVASAKAVGAQCNSALGIMTFKQVFGYPAVASASNKLLQNLYYAKAEQKINYEMMQSFEPSSFAKVSDSVLDFIFPKAQASWLPLLGLGAGTAVAFFALTATAAVEIDMMMFVPFNRAIAFGAMAGVAFLASQSSQGVMDKLDENIKKIEEILADLDKLAKGTKAQNMKAQAITIKTLGAQSQSAGGGTTGITAAKTPCLTSNQTSNCATLESQLSSVPGYEGLPASFKGLTTQAVRMGDSISGSDGISGSALTNANALGGKMNAIKKLQKNRESALEKLSGGKKNMADEQQKFLNKVRGGIKNALGKKGMTATGMMGSMGSIPIDSSSIPKTAEEDSLKKGKGAVGNVVDTSASGAGAEEKEEGLKLDFKEDPSAANFEMASAGGVGGAAAPEYDIQGNEIGGENGPSIFEVISNRYIKSGYPKLLEEEQPVTK